MLLRKPNRRWYHLTPDRFFVGLLMVQVFLLLSERFQWFAFNEKKGWTVLIAIGVVCVAVLVMLVWGLVCLCLRWRFQFSFRSLLVFLMTVSVPLGWFAWEMQKARRQREAVERIVKAGAAGVTYDYEEDQNGVWDGRREPNTPKWLLAMLGQDFFHDAVLVWGDFDFGDNDVVLLGQLPHLRMVYLSFPQLTDASLGHLRGLTELETLSFSATQVTDAGLLHLSGITSLEGLQLGDTQITDAGLVHLRKMRILQFLDLGRTQVSDDGLKHLAHLHNLKSLYLNKTQVTDSSLPHLKSLAGLKELWLEGTKVTAEGVKKLQQALPNCEIIH